MFTAAGVISFSYLCASDRFHIRGRETAWDAICDVDVDGDFHSQCYRDHSVLHHARSDADAVSEVQQAFGAVVYVLSELRRGIDADLQGVSQETWGRMVELRILRDVIDGAGWKYGADKLSKDDSRTPEMSVSGVFAELRLSAQQRAQTTIVQLNITSPLIAK